MRTRQPGSDQVRDPSCPFEGHRLGDGTGRIRSPRQWPGAPTWATSTRRIATTSAIGGLLVAPLLLTGCDSTGPSAAGTVTPCQQVSAVLTDGPDPTADPVGYAQTQILPLRQIRAGDARLHSAIDALAAAYQQFVVTDGSASATQAVDRTGRAVDAICPGAVT